MVRDEFLVDHTLAAQHVEQSKRVLRSFPADAAGIQKGDQLVNVDDTEIWGFLDLLRALQPKHEGDVVKVEGIRDGKRYRVAVTLRSRDE